MKNYLVLSTIFVLALMTSCSDDDNNSSHDSINLEQGLVAYYPFNGNADDDSGNDFDGNVQGNPELFENAINGSGNSYDFSNDNQVITTSNQIDNDLGDGATFSAWIYVEGNTAPFTGRILSNFNGNDPSEANCNRRVGFVFGVTETGAINTFYATSSPLYYGRITEEDALEGDKWHHILTTWDGTRKSSGFKIYIDGERRDDENFQAGEEASFCDSYIQSEQPFHIGLGTCAAGPCSPFKGAIDEVRIYKRILNQDEINELFVQRSEN